MRINFEQHLNKLNDEIIEMGNLVTDAIENAVRSLAEKDVELAREVYEGDQKINDKETEIEAQALNLLLKEQPVASDFRFVTTALRMVTDLERIGDQASDISYLILKLNKRTYHRSDLGSIYEMAKITIEMVKTSLKAYVDADLSLIDEVMKSEELVDEYFEKVRYEVVQDVKEDRFDTKNSLDILLIAKYLERIGDHCTNITERVYYSITGQYRENN